MYRPLGEQLNRIGKSVRRTALEVGGEPARLNAYASGKRRNQRNTQRVANGLGVELSIARRPVLRPQSVDFSPSFGEVTRTQRTEET